MRWFCLLFCCLLLLLCCSCGSSRRPSGGDFYGRGVRAEASGSAAEAVRCYEQAILAGDHAAEAHRRLGALHGKDDPTLPLAIWHYQAFLKTAEMRSPEARSAGISLDVLEKRYFRILREKWEGSVDADKDFRIGLLEEREEILKQNMQRINEENHLLRQLLLEEKKSDPTPREQTTQQPAAGPENKEPPEAALRMHRVAPGDTIGRIASRYYGSSRIENIRRIMAANRGQLADPDRLRVGQMLVIPR